MNLRLSLLSLFSLLCLQATGHSHSINWHKISGGGCTSTCGVYSVSDTIDQHDAGGPTIGGSYSLTGGFWALISVVQTSGAPTLYVSHSGHTVTFYWQALAGWKLRQTANLAAGNGGWPDSSAQKQIPFSSVFLASVVTSTFGSECKHTQRNH